ncbi:MAG: killer suppression protein [Candidatus Competibacteraceae bacterium]|nr:killer suppression protein [Candidatus Competibacteraceae bacterium]
MQISYINKKLAKLLGDRKATVREYGPDNGKRILLRLDQMAAAETLAELAKLPQTRVHELKADRNEQISVDVKHPYRLLLVPDHPEIPRKEDGGLDHTRITKVTVLGIADTH